MKELLLRRVLARIPSLPAQAGHRLALAASERGKEGRLLSLTCDAWDMPLSHIAKAAGIAEVEVSKFVAGILDLSAMDRARLEAAVSMAMRTGA